MVAGLAAQALLEVGADGLDEVGAVHGFGLNTFHEVNEVLGHNAGVQSVEASCLELVAKVHEVLEAVLLAALAQSTAPSEDGSHWVGRGLLSLKILAQI